MEDLNGTRGLYQSVGRVLTGDNQAPPEFQNRAGWRYIHSLQSVSSRKTHRSHLNWCARTILESQGVSVACLLDDFNCYLSSENKLQDSDLYWLHDWSDLDGPLTHWLLDKKRTTPVVNRSNTKTYPSPNTLNAFRSALRGVANYAFELGLIDERQFHQVNSVKRVHGGPLTHPVILNDKEIQEVMKTLQQDNSTRGKRDCAIFAVMLGAGLRRSEVGKVKINEYHSAKDNQTAFFSVIGKDNKDTEVHLPRWAASYVEDWIYGHRGADKSGPVFCRIRKDDQPQGDYGLTADGIAWILNSRLKDLDLGEHLRANDLRRTFAERLNERTRDILMVQEALRLSRIDSARLYLQKSPTRVAAAAASDDANF